MSLQAPSSDETIAVPLDDGERLVLRRYRNPHKPMLAVCHGNGFATDGYAPFWNSLMAEFELFVFDLRHHGWNAPQDPMRTGFDRYADDLDRVYRTLREFKTGVPVYGAFHSLSAIIALLQATSFPSLPDGLFLFDPPIQPPKHHPLHALANGFELKLADWAGARPCRFRSPEALSILFGKSRSLSDWTEGAHDLMARSILRPDGEDWMLACPPSVEAQNYRDNAAFISWDLFELIDVPLAFICGDPQHPAGQSPAQVCAALAKDRGFSYRSIPGTTHMLQIEKPEACRDALCGFLSDMQSGEVNRRA